MNQTLQQVNVDWVEDLTEQSRLAKDSASSVWNDVVGSQAIVVHVARLALVKDHNVTSVGFLLWNDWQLPGPFAISTCSILGNTLHT